MISELFVIKTSEIWLVWLIGSYIFNMVKSWILHVIIMLYVCGSCPNLIHLYYTWLEKHFCLFVCRRYLEMQTLLSEYDKSSLESTNHQKQFEIECLVFITDILIQTDWYRLEHEIDLINLVKKEYTPN